MVGVHDVSDPAGSVACPLGGGPTAAVDVMGTVSVTDGNDDGLAIGGQESVMIGGVRMPVSVPDDGAETG